MVKALVVSSGSRTERLVGYYSAMCAFSLWELVEAGLESEGCSARQQKGCSFALPPLPKGVMM